MPLGSQTQVVDGQRNIFPTAAQWSPTSYGQQTTGVPQVSPTMPPFLGGSTGSVGALGVAEGVGGYGTAGNNAAVTQIAADHPHNLKVSPVWWAVVALLTGVLLLRATAWRRTVLEAGDERVRVGDAGESASERV